MPLTCWQFVTYNRKPASLEALISVSKIVMIMMILTALESNTWKCGKSVYTRIVLRQVLITPKQQHTRVLPYVVTLVIEAEVDDPH